MKRKVLSLISAGIIGVALLLPGNSLAATHVKFNDINGHWGQKHIEHFAELGIISGMGQGKFAPNATIAKEHVQILLKKASGKDVTLPLNHRVAVIAGIVNAFDLNSEANKLTDKEVSEVLGKFKDKNTIPAEDLKAAAYMVKLGIISGIKSDEFAPHGTVTRAQVVSFIGRLAEKGKITLKPYMGEMKDGMNMDGMNSNNMNSNNMNMGGMKH